MDQLHIPEGINYECTGCGNCCLQWPVPATAEDFSRISAIDLPGDQSYKALLRPLKTVDPKLSAFTHTLEKRTDGKCQFLTTENRCWLHQTYEASTKPAMCQLFPYTFNPTPSGVYASVSFASTGALLNSGQPLCSQENLLRTKWDLFQHLFPNLKPDWSKTQLVNGTDLKWDDYLQLDKEILRLIRSPQPKQIEQRLLSCSRFICKQLSTNSDPDRQPQLRASQKTVDQLLLKHFLEFYFPDDVFGNSQTDFDTDKLMHDLINPPAVIEFSHGTNIITVKQLLDLRLGDLGADSEDLLFRFVLCRVFAKLYFGFGFANLSVLAGLHHLAFLIAAVRIRIKLSVLSEGKSIDFLELVEVVRTLERRLTQANLSEASRAALEALLTSPSRLDRIISLCG